MDLVDALIHGISHDRQPVRFDSERICRLICIKANSIQWMKIMPGCYQSFKMVSNPSNATFSANSSLYQIIGKSLNVCSKSFAIDIQLVDQCELDGPVSLGLAFIEIN